MSKATHASAVKQFTDIPNIGPAMVADFKLLGILSPGELKKCDGFKLYSQLCKVTGKRHDPCVLDTFLAAVDFMKGAEAKPWFAYTEGRKVKYPNI
jgi:Pathogenicity locus